VIAAQSFSTIFSPTPLWRRLFFVRILYHLFFASPRFRHFPKNQSCKSVSFLRREPLKQKESAPLPEFFPLRCFVGMGKKAIVTDRRPKRAPRSGIPNSLGKKYRKHKEKEVTSDKIRKTRRALVAEFKDKAPEHRRGRVTYSAPTSKDCQKYVNIKMKKIFAPRLIEKT
jgi:hypothetical protein